MIAATRFAETSLVSTFQFSTSGHALLGVDGRVVGAEHLRVRAIAPQLARNRRAPAPQPTGNFRLMRTLGLQRLDLISLVTGQLSVAHDFLFLVVEEPTSCRRLARCVSRAFSRAFSRLYRQREQSQLIGRPAPGRRPPQVTTRPATTRPTNFIVSAPVVLRLSPELDRTAERDGGLLPNTSCRIFVSRRGRSHRLRT
jgi:hypothetical protein